MAPPHQWQFAGFNETDQDVVLRDVLSFLDRALA
jgi:hypothetical protein